MGAVLAVALVAGLTVWLTDGSKPKTLDHVGYARLWTRTSIGTRMNVVLGQWPKPYQVYHDGYMHRCYEWWDKPLFLYNLCFDRSNGLLVNKELT